jgi:hypothetical protein
MITGIDVLNAYVPVPDRASACPFQSTAEEMKTKIHFKGLSHDKERNNVGISQMPVSSENITPGAARIAWCID